ncbi:hypothetical protein [Roseiconus nitratireducens]|uniref:hypothetical protein n=1 Tax=Roseiconus nitratireducens TaxID=2605748 RepID=UPI00191C20DC|nr:hypothetical protein [Roseiconus nitratireducens]
MRNLLLSFSLIVCFAAIVGCGPSDDVTVSPVDDSVVHTEEEMKELEAQNAADMQSR